MMRGAADAAWRLAFRIGYPLARQWWRLTRPDQHGALVAIWVRGELLVVQQSYRRLLSLPGGGIHRGEAPRAAARRELAEELGLEVAEASLVLAFETTVTWEYRQDHVRIFELHRDAAPAVTIDRREIVGTRLMAPRAVLAGPLAPHLRAYLEWREGIQRSEQ
jgi:8-oxo-dGTP pyrophosphatase MutT (NUDIX family)